MNIDELFNFCKEKIKQFPHLEEEIMDCHQNACANIIRFGFDTEKEQCIFSKNEIIYITKDETS